MIVDYFKAIAQDTNSVQLLQYSANFATNFNTRYASFTFKFRSSLLDDSLMTLSTKAQRHSNGISEIMSCESQNS